MSTRDKGMEVKVRSGIIKYNNNNIVCTISVQLISKNILVTTGIERI